MTAVPTGAQEQEPPNNFDKMRRAGANIGKRQPTEGVVKPRSRFIIK